MTSVPTHDRCLHCGLAYAGRSRPVRMFETAVQERLGIGVAGQLAGTMHAECSRLYSRRGFFKREEPP